MHLRFNFQILSAHYYADFRPKSLQVSNDLPPEAKDRVIEVQVKDSEFAAMSLSFYSEVLDQNQITDFLTRVVQPRLSSIPGVQRADILGGRVVAMRIWLKPDKLASLNLPPAEVQAALQANNYLAAVGKTKGSMIAVNLVANTDLKTAEEFRSLVIRQDKGAIVRLATLPTWFSAQKSSDNDVRFSGQKATFRGISPFPECNTLNM